MRSSVVVPLADTTLDLFGHEPATVSKWAPLFSSKSDEWPTDAAVVEEWARREGPFTLDPCCTAESAKAPRFFTKADDGLSQAWFGVVWMNPPYSEIEAWIGKALTESARGCTVVCLLPSRTGTRWFHMCIAAQDRCAFHFCRGRLKFGGVDGSAPFDSLVIVMRPPPMR